MAIKNITEVENKTNIVGDETLLGIDKDNNVVQMSPSNIPELTEAAGNETVIGVSNGKVVRIPVDSIGGGGSVEPIILRSQNSTSIDVNVVYNDGSAVNADDIMAAFMSGIPILIGYTQMGKTTIDMQSTIYRVVNIHPTENVIDIAQGNGIIKPISL